MMLALAIKSLRNRRFTATLTVVSIGLAVTLLLGVERLRQESRESFAATVSGTDLVVGARSSPINLLLYSIFRIGNPTNNLSWESYRTIAGLEQVAWTIPMSLGDSHRGFRVVGTTASYYEHYRYAGNRPLELGEGELPRDDHDTVLGSEVARKLGYSPGDSIVIAHGAGDVSFSLHDEQPFTVTGVLEPTGTPVDRAVHVTLEGLDAVHSDVSHSGTHDPLEAALNLAQTSRNRGEMSPDDHRPDHEDEHEPHGTHESDHHDDHQDNDHDDEHDDDKPHDSRDAHEDEHHDDDHDEHHAGGQGNGDHDERHEDHSAHHNYHALGASGRSISAFLVGLKSRPAALSVQRYVNEYEGEALSAIMPGVALQELWEVTGAAERTLRAVSVLVVLVGLTGMLVALLTSLGERRREMAILRSVGAGPRHVFALILGEAVLLTTLGIVLGVAALYAGLALGQSWLESQLGLFIGISWPSWYEIGLIAMVGIAGGLIGLVPAWRIYKYSLSDGMTVRI